MFETIWQHKPGPSVAVPQDELREGWGLPRNVEELVRSMAGPTFHCFQSPTQATSYGDEGEAVAAKGNQVILVFFIGGVTYAEIAALRFLASKAEGTEHYIWGRGEACFWPVFTLCFCQDETLLSALPISLTEILS